MKAFTKEQNIEILQHIRDFIHYVVPDEFENWLNENTKEREDAMCPNCNNGRLWEVVVGYVCDNCQQQSSLVSEDKNTEKEESICLDCGHVPCHFEQFVLINKMRTCPYWIEKED